MVSLPSPFPFCPLCVALCPAPSSSWSSLASYSFSEAISDESSTISLSFPGIFTSSSLQANLFSRCRVVCVLNHTPCLSPSLYAQTKNTHKGVTPHNARATRPLLCPRLAESLSYASLSLPEPSCAVAADRYANKGILIARRTPRRVAEARALYPAGPGPRPTRCRRLSCPSRLAWPVLFRPGYAAYVYAPVSCVPATYVYSSLSRTARKLYRRGVLSVNRPAAKWQFPCLDRLRPCLCSPRPLSNSFVPVRSAPVTRVFFFRSPCCRVAAVRCLLACLPSCLDVMRNAATRVQARGESSCACAWGVVGDVVARSDVHAASHWQVVGGC